LITSLDGMRKHRTFLNLILCHSICHDLVGDPCKAGESRYDKDPRVDRTALVLILFAPNPCV